MNPYTRSVQAIDVNNGPICKITFTHYLIRGDRLTIVTRLRLVNSIDEVHIDEKKKKKKILHVDRIDRKYLTIEVKQVKGSLFVLLQGCSWLERTQ